MSISSEERRRLASFFARYPLASRGRLVHVVGGESLEYSRMSEAMVPRDQRAFARVRDLDEALRYLGGERAAAIETALARAGRVRVDLA